MSVAVVIPWRDLGDPSRQAALAYVLAHYARLALGPVIQATADPYTKPRALNAAIRALPEDAIVVQSDADSFLPREATYREAIRLAEQPGLVVPHSQYLYLNADATQGSIRDGRLVRLATQIERDCDEDGLGGVGNVTVFSRATWKQAGGYDERFPVWGGDDAAFAIACGALVAPMRRLPGDVIHLWHPRAPESDSRSESYARSLELIHEYHRAAEDGTVAELVTGR